MDLEHEFTVNAPIDTAWATMMDIEGVAECFPGATLTSADKDSFEGTVKVKLGPIALVYKGSGNFTERDDSAHRAVIEAKGKDKRGNGTAGATVTMSLTESGSDTSVSVVTDLNVTGKPAQFGRGVMQDVSDKLLGQFVDCLATKVSGPQSTGPSSAEPEPSPVGSSGSAGAGSAGQASGGGVESTGQPTGVDAGPAPAAATMSAAAATGAAAGSGRPPAAAAPVVVGSGDASASRPSTSSPDATKATTSTTTRAEARRGGSGDALDLGAAVGPVILRTYAPYVAAGIGGLLLGWLLGRRRGRRARRD